MLKIFLIASSLILGSVAMADGNHHHTETVCSEKSLNVCAHLGIHNALNTRDEGKFIAHVETVNEAPVSNLQVELWMPDMGHGSAPVDIKDAGQNHYLVSNAWFPMEGKWIVKLDFEFESEKHHIEIPVEIVK